MLFPGANYINGRGPQKDHSPNFRGKETLCQLALLSHASIYAYTLFPFLVAILLKSSGLDVRQAVLLKGQNPFQNRSSIVHLRTPTSFPHLPMGITVSALRGL